MSKRGSGYGSEDHLRRLLTSEGRELDAAILGEIERADSVCANGIEWHANYLDDACPELRGMDFLSATERGRWKAYWPDPKTDPLRVGTQTWDAVGKLQMTGGTFEWLLIEAKGHLSELEATPACGAGQKSKAAITAAFRKTRFNMGLAESEQTPVPDSWFRKGCYQTANRLASLNFLLHEIKASARLIFLYFTGDEFVRRICPASSAEWRPLLRQTYAALELPGESLHLDRVHTLFINVRHAKRVE